MYVNVVVAYVCMLTALETLALLKSLVNKESESDLNLILGNVIGTSPGPWVQQPHPQ